MSDTLILCLAVVTILGIGAQWLAWRMRIPSILLLLLCGFVSGPVIGFINPDELLGDLLFPFVSFSIGIILFEGGLSLRLDELREVGRTVRNLISIGVFATWLLSAAAAYYILRFNLSLSIVLGAILVVTGPTVIVPLLRHIRPIGRVGTIAKWEGITIDPIGAILAVLVSETILLINESVIKMAQEVSFEALFTHAVQGLLLTFFISLGVSITGAVFLILLLRRRLLPDYLQNSVALMVVIGVFALADMLQQEAGLLATTLMGIALANQRFVNVQKIIAFKEDLRVLLIGGLFVLLSARLNLSDLKYIDLRSIIFLIILIIIIRPAAVLLSSLGTKCTWKEVAFLSWLAPRGIVAAAVTMLFSYRLQEYFPEGTNAMVPIVFWVIAGTVTIYSLSITPFAQWLGLAQPEPQGLLIIGAHQWAQKLALALKKHQFNILMVDSNPQNIADARTNGLSAIRANVLSERVLDDLNLGGIGYLLALTSNDEVNSLAALHFADIFDSSHIYQLCLNRAEKDDEAIPKRLRGRALFDGQLTFGDLQERFARGDELFAFQIGKDFSFKKIKENYGEEAVPLFLVRVANRLEIFSEDSEPDPEPDDHLILLVNISEKSELKKTDSTEKSTEDVSFSS